MALYNLIEKKRKEKRKKIVKAEIGRASCRERV